MTGAVRRSMEERLGAGAYPAALSVLLSIAVSLQLLIIIAAVFSFIPIKLDSSLDDVLPQVLALFRPEREMFLYQFFVVMTVIVQTVLVVVLKDRWQDEGFFRKLGRYLAAEYIWIALEIFAVFKILVYKGPFWANALFYVTLVLSIVSKVFWPEVQVWGARIYNGLIGLSRDRRFVRAFDVCVIGSLMLFLWVPDVTSVLATIFTHDQWFELDSFLAAPAHALAQGRGLQTDAFAPLGAGVATVMFWLTQMFGGFNYEHLISAMIALTLVYFVACYALLRLWFKSVLIAAAGVLMLIKLQLFNIGAAPVVWAFPQHTPLRSLLDLLPIYLLWCYGRDAKRFYLWMAAAACGLSMAYVADTGFYQTLALYGYLAVLFVLPKMRRGLFAFPRDARKILAVGLMPWGSMVIFLFLLSGPVIFTKAYWVGNSEFLNGFWQGFGNVAIISALNVRQFFAFAMGLVIPVIFLAVGAIVILGNYLRGTSRKNLWIVFVCFYGLASHSYFIHRSIPAMYSVYSLPLTIIGCYGLRLLADAFSRERRRIVLLVAALSALGALLTNSQFVHYPNALNLTRHDWKNEHELYRLASSFEKDAAFIQGLTKPGERTAVISSFATKMLMDAGRRPYFYYSPVIVSAPMQENVFKGTALFTKDRMQKTLDQLQQDPPAYIFVEKKIYNLQVPADYQGSLQSWLALKDHIAVHYEPSGQGQYVMALKRKP